MFIRYIGALQFVPNGEQINSKEVGMIYRGDTSEIMSSDGFTVAKTVLKEVAKRMD